MNKKDIKIGMKFYRDNDAVSEYTVKKIGSKYFTVEESHNLKFSIETLKYESPMYSQHNVQLYNSKQEVLDLRETQDLYKKLTNHFYGFGRLESTLEELRSAAKALKLIE